MELNNEKVSCPRPPATVLRGFVSTLSCLHMSLSPASTCHSLLLPHVTLTCLHVPLSPGSTCHQVLAVHKRCWNVHMMSKCCWTELRHEYYDGKTKAYGARFMLPVAARRTIMSRLECVTSHHITLGMRSLHHPRIRITAIILHTVHNNIPGVHLWSETSRTMSPAKVASRFRSPNFGDFKEKITHHMPSHHITSYYTT